MMADFVEYKKRGSLASFWWTVSTMQTLQNKTKKCGGSTKGLCNHLQDKTLDTLVSSCIQWSHVKPG